MSTSRTENTLRNMGWGFVRRFVALCGPFVVRMLLIERLGADYLGLSTFYTSLLQMLNIAELGFSTAVSYGMYGPIATEDDEAVARYLAYLKRAYRVVGLALLALGVALAPLLGLLVEGPVPDDVNLALAFSLFLSNTALGYLLFAHKQTLLVAHQRKDVVDKVQAAALLSQYAIQSALLLAAPNFYTYAFALPLFGVISNVAVARIADRLYPQFREGRTRSLALGASERIEVRKRIFGLVLQKGCMLTREPFAVVLLSAFAGLEAVACFGNYFAVIAGLLGILGVLGASMTAAVGNSVALESTRKNFDDLRLFVFLYACASILCAAVVLALYQPFMILWMGERMLLPFDAAMLFVAYFYVRTMGDMRSVYVDATGVWWGLKWRAVVETAGNIVFCLLLVPLLGLRGAMLALLASLFLFNFAYGSHLVFKLYFGLDKARAYYVDHFCYLGLGALVCAASLCISSLVPDGGVLLLAVKGLVAGGSAAALLVLAFFRSRRFAQARTFLVRMGKHRVALKKGFSQYKGGGL